MPIQNASDYFPFDRSGGIVRRGFNFDRRGLNQPVLTIPVGSKASTTLSWNGQNHAGPHCFAATAVRVADTGNAATRTVSLRATV